MKKYHLADVFTALEFACGFIIFIMAFYGVKPEIVVFLYGFAEICDALDGPCARRWHYPNDNKYRWWRYYAPQLDQISDLLVGVAIGVYFTWRINFTLGLIILIAAIIIGLTVQTVAYDFPPIGLNLLENRPKVGTVLVLVRRWLYVITLALIALNLILATGWARIIKLTLCGVLSAICLILLFSKINRLIEVKTPL